MNFFKHLFLVAFVGVSVSLLHAQDGALNTATDPIESFIDHGTKGLEVTYKAGDVSIVKEEFIEGHTWQHIAIPGYVPGRTTGMPQLPVRTELIVVPAGATYNWSFTVGSTESKQSYRVYPTLPPATDRYGDPEPTFDFDPVVYSSNAFYPESPVNITTIQKYRELTLIWFEISPIQYNPITGVINVHHDIKLDISFSGAKSFMNYSDHSEHFLRSFPLSALNIGSVQKEIREHLDQGGSQSGPAPSSYIILTDTMYINAANKLADWKRQLGFTVEVVSKGGWTHAGMRSEVHSRYQQWLPKPDYLLIIGDHDKMPAQMLQTPNLELFGSDLHLVTMDGPSDFVPEMAKGRISINSAAQAMSVVDKIIDYEKTPPSDTTFYKTGLNCAQFQDDDFDSFEDRRFVLTSEDIRNYLGSKGYNINRVYYADMTNSSPQYYNSTIYSNGQPIPNELNPTTFNWNGGAGNIINHINNGAFYVLHRDHGYVGGSGWHAPEFVTGHINSLNNGVKTPVVFSINCHTGEFTLSECFAERFLRHNKGGAVGVVAASYYSYSGWNDAFSIGMFDAIWASPGLTVTYGSGGIANPVANPHPNIRNMGYVVNYGLLRMTQTWSSGYSSNEYTHRLFHYFGDPAMRIRTEIPTLVTATHSDSVQCGNPSFIVSNVNMSDAIATLTIPGRTIGSATVTAGSASIPIEPYSSPYLILTVSAPEGIPLIDTIWVIPGQLDVTVSSKDVLCSGKPEGEINLTISCGVNPITTQWQHGPTTSFVSGLIAGTYYFTVTDGSNYSITDSVIITEPPLPIVSNHSITEVSCYYGANGAISATVSGGISPYQYKWSNMSTATSISNLAAGMYRLTITDNIGCMKVDTITVPQPQPLKVDVSVIHDITNNCTGEATALPTGGTSPYSYVWNDPSAQTTVKAVKLCPGLVRVTVTDNNGCLAVKSFYVYNTSGIEEKESASAKIYPNPITGNELIIELPGMEDNTDIIVELYNHIGSLIESYAVLPSEQRLIISPFPGAPGMYHVIIKTSDNSLYFSEKIIKLLNR